MSGPGWPGNTGQDESQRKMLAYQRQIDGLMRMLREARRHLEGFELAERIDRVIAGGSPETKDTCADVLEVTVGRMEESNGRVTYSAFLNRKGGSIFDGYQFASSASKGRVDYEADKLRQLLDPSLPDPDILAYDTDLPEQGEERLWLWRNFVDGRPEYWAFDNHYPCFPNGDPITLGEPCGYAVVKDSIRGRHDVSDEQVIAAIKRSLRSTEPQT